MPLVQMWFKPERVEREHLDRLLEQLPGMVVRALTLNGTIATRPTEKEVMVKCDPLFGRNTVNMPDVLVVVFAKQELKHNGNLSRCSDILTDAVSLRLATGISFHCEINVGLQLGGGGSGRAKEE